MCQRVLHCSQSLFVSGGKRRHRLPGFVHLPLAPKSMLSWMGFTDQGTPTVMDTAGFVRTLNDKYGCWTQVCDTKAHVKGKSDHYFLVGVNEIDFNVRAILVKGSRFPQTVPRPVVAVLPLNVPLCNPDSEKTKLEEEYWRCDLIGRSSVVGENNDDNEAAQMGCLVKLFALACKSEHESRAIEACKLMNSQTIQLAMQYASKIRRMQLATKIAEMACERQEEEKEEEQRIQQEAYTGSFRRGHDEDESQDLFYPTQQEKEIEETPQNPFLATKYRKENHYSANTGIAKSNHNSTPESPDSRNPFKKSSTIPRSVSRSDTGSVVFDGLQQKEPQKLNQNNANSAFGPRSVKLGSSSSGIVNSYPMLKPKQGGQFQLNKPEMIKPGKENVTAGVQKQEQQPLVALKGFQLWLAENMAELTQKERTDDVTTIQSIGLEVSEGTFTPLCWG